MSTHKEGSNVLITESVFQPNQGRVDLVKTDFDKLVYQKGYDIYLDRALKCPCRNVKDNQALSACKNCGGSGWVFFNRQSSKAVIQSMNKDTKFKEWSEEDRGNAKITFHQELQVSFMDRITLVNGFAIHSQNIHCILTDSKIKGKLLYDPLEISEIFLFEGTDTKLKFLEHNTDFTVDKNIITLNDSYLPQHSEEEPITISLRYKHHPQFHVIDLPRETISSYKGEANQILPVHAIARKSHYILDEQNYGVNWLFNNDYTPQCSTYQAGKDVVTLLRKIINTDNSDQTLEELLASGAFLTIVSQDSTQQSLLELYIVDQVDDETSDAIVYVGKLKGDGKWLIEKITISDNNDEELIDIEYFNGPTINNYQSSWDNRENLAYIPSENLSDL